MNCHIWGRNLEFSDGALPQAANGAGGAGRNRAGSDLEGRKSGEVDASGTEVGDVLEDISGLEWNWAGRVAGMTDGRWTTPATFWTPRGYKRNRGRPKTRWRDDLDQHQRRWHQAAQDRKLWKDLGKAYVQQRTFEG